jgi:hypothetical protein
MRKLACLVLSFGLFGCASRAPLSYEEHCALKGMSVAGVTSSQSSGFVQGSNGRFATVSGSSEQISCQPPKDEHATCEVRRHLAAAEPKLEYNSTTGGWDAAMGVGYLFYIIPGIGIKIAADAKYDEAVKRSAWLDSQSQNACADVRVPAAAAPQSAGAIDVNGSPVN